jgi:septal ring factor EnvC (AmiA/AmiB activator)
MTAAYTRRLTSARLEFASDAQARAVMRSVLVAVLLVLAVVEGLRLLADGATAASQRSRVQQENAALRTEVARLGAELQLERATRDAIDRQVVDLNHELADLERQLAFLTAQRSRPSTATRKN